MVFVTLIPLYRNDGTPVDEAERQSILTELWTRFGGLTIEGTTLGHWIDAVDGKHYQDECLKATVECNSARLAEAEEAVLEIGKLLGAESHVF